MSLITLKEVIQELATVSQTGSEGGPPPNSLQIFVNRFAGKYDTDVRSYIELQVLRLMSGSLLDKTERTSMTWAEAQSKGQGTFHL